MTVDDLVKLNPNSKDGKVSIGEVLLINKSASNISTTQAKPTSSTSKLGKITLKPKQTIYGITKQYQISENELRGLNPELDSKMKIGDVIILPLPNIQKFGDGQEEVAVVTAAPKTGSKLEPTNSVDIIVADENSYTVQPKDNYYKLSRKFNLNQKELYQTLFSLLFSLSVLLCIQPQ